MAGKGWTDYSLSVDLSVVICAACFAFWRLLKIPVAAPTDLLPHADAHNQDKFGFAQWNTFTFGFLASCSWLMLGPSCVVKQAVLLYLVSLCDALCPEYPNVSQGACGEAAGAQPTPSILEALDIFSSALAVSWEWDVRGEPKVSEWNPKCMNSLWSAEKHKTFPTELVLWGHCAQGSHTKKIKRKTLWAL